MSRVIYIVLLSLVSISALSSSVFSQVDWLKRCESESEKVQYDLIAETISGTVSKKDKSDDTVMLFIRLDRKKFTKDKLGRLIERIKSVYCNAPRLQAVFFEDEESYAKYLGKDYQTLRVYEVVRAFYSFDKLKCDENLELSEKLGLPTRTVDLTRAPGPDPQC